MHRLIPGKPPESEWSDLDKMSNLCISVDHCNSRYQRPMFFQLGDSSHHLNIRIEPKLSIAAGFEKNTDVFINTMPPEDAAGSLREIDAPLKV